VKPRWHLVGHACELARPDDYILVPWPFSGSGELAVYVEADGSLVAFDNVCAHRGARIFSGLAGNRPPVCRYHGRRVVSQQVERYDTKVSGGWVWAYSTPGTTGKGISDVAVCEIREASNGLLSGGAADCVKVGDLLMYYGCHWSTAVENALDLEHVEHVHSGSLAKLGLSRLELRTFGDGSSLELFEADRKQAKRLDALTGALGARPWFDYAHAHVYPFAAVSSTRGLTYSLQLYCPRHDGSTAFIHKLYAPRSVAEQPRAQVFLQSAAQMNHTIFAEDAEICRGLPAAFDVEGRLGPRDDRVAAFRKAFMEERNTCQG
jgi:phenylpropionate dioxygenase-like ring-hydroxylating dioxygenase large terminal subunit